MTKRDQPVAFITGVTSGLGKALAECYLGQDWLVYGVGRNQVALDELASRFDNFNPVVLDVTNRLACLNAIGQIEGNIQLAILNAGNCEYLSLDNFDSQAVARMMDCNINSVAHCVEGLLTKLKSGSQLAIMSSSVTFLPIAKAEAYGASKAAADYFTRTLSIGLKQKGIATSLIQPGFVDTPLTAKNEFSMPFLMSAETAAHRIIQGLNNKKSTIAFPRRLIWSLKLLNCLPLSLSHWLLNG